MGPNIVPGGSTYSGGGTYTLNVNTSTTYVITWGVNDTSVNICGTTYTSPGSGTQIIVFTGPCSTMVFTGTGGSTVTVLVQAGPGRIPIPSGFTFLPSTSGALAVANWNTTGLNMASTQIWTSTDGVTYVLTATVPFPTSTWSTTAPAAGTYLYAKINFVGLGGLTGQQTAPQTVSGQVANWAARVITNGGAAVSVNTITAMNTFDLSINSGALQSSIISMIAMVPDNLTAAITPLYKTLGNDPYTNNGYVAGDLTTTGLTGDGVAKYLDSGVNASNAIGPNGGLALYVPANYNTGTVQDDCGGFDAGAGRALEISFTLSAGNFGFSAGNYGSFLFQSSNAGPLKQLAVKMGWNNGATRYINSGTITAGGVFTWASGNLAAGNLDHFPAVSMFCGARNANGVANGFSNKTISFFAVVGLMDQTQTTNFCNAVQALRVALGGGFV